jgi:hypothetical protein
MVDWSHLVLPAALAAILVFIASSVIHMVLQMHKADYRKLSNEDEVRGALRAGAPQPGQYVVPHCADPKQMSSPEFIAKLEEGANAVVFVRPNGTVKLGPFLGKWFAYTFVVGLLAGYVAMASLPAGAPYLSVFRVVGAASWLAYAWQAPSDSIWMGKPWSITLRAMADGLVYALLTAGTFAWLWPPP